MIFLFPGFLWALTALAIPVIIHLFNFQKYRKVYFTNVRFLRQLEEETRSRSRLKEWLVLLCRCLAIAALVIAFAQPILPGASAGTLPGNRAVSIYIDNSFSMENVNRQGPLLEIAKTRAKELVSALAGNDRVQVITNDFEGRHQRLYSPGDAGRLIDEIRVSPASRLFTEVIDRQQEFLRGTEPAAKRIYCFSDAQRSTFNLSTARPDSLIGIHIIPLAANRVNNVFLDTCWFESPLQQKGFIQKLHARIQNKGESVIDVGSAKVFLNQRQLAISGFSVKEGGTAEVVFTFECREEGFAFGSIKIEDFPVTFDDELFFAFNSRLNIRACVINGKGITPANPLVSLFSADSLFSLSTLAEETIDYSQFRKSDLIVLNQLSDLGTGLVSELIKFTSRGGAILMIPPETLPPSYNAALSGLGLPVLGAVDTNAVRAAEISPENPFFAGVFEKMNERINLPLVKMHYTIQRSSRSDHDVLLRLQNGDEMLTAANMNNAGVFLFSMPLTEAGGNFSRHALFVPVLYQLSFRSARRAPLFHEAASNVAIDIRHDHTTEEPPHITGLNGSPDIIPGIRTNANGVFLLTQGQVKDPGFYEVRRPGSAVMPLAFNYSRLESDLASYSAPELQQMVSARGFRNVNIIEDVASGISGKAMLGDEGTGLWKLFIFLALAFMLTEVLLLRLLR
jgi:hypothetical protein